MHLSCHNSAIHHSIFADNPNQAPLGGTEQITAGAWLLWLPQSPLSEGPASLITLGQLVLSLSLRGRIRNYLTLFRRLAVPGVLHRKRASNQAVRLRGVR